MSRPRRGRTIRGRLIVAAALLLSACTAGLPTRPPRATLRPADPMPSATGSQDAGVSPTTSPAPSTAASPSEPTPSLAPFPVSPSPSPVPSGSPAASPVTGVFVVVLADELDDRRSGFPTGDFEHQRVAYEQGDLVMRVRTASRATWTTRGFGDWPLVEVSAPMSLDDAPTDGFHGLICGPDADTFLAGLLGSDGTVVMLRVTDGVATPLARGIASPPVGGATLMLSCTGTDAGGATSVSLAVDGEVIAVATDPEGFPAFRRAGFYAESGTQSLPFVARAASIRIRAGLRAPGASPLAPSGSPAATDDPAVAALLAVIPESLRAACRPVSASEAAVVAAVDCATGDVASARYVRFASGAAMAAVYDRLVASHPEATGSCDTAPGEGPWQVDGVEAGRLLCVRQGAAARFVWTDARSAVLGDASRADGDFGELFEWWLEAGPLP
jgi:hypothetical protein